LKNTQKKHKYIKKNKNSKIENHQNRFKNKKKYTKKTLFKKIRRKSASNKIKQTQKASQTVGESKNWVHKDGKRKNIF